MLSYAHDSYQDVLNAVCDVVDAIVMQDTDAKLKLVWLNGALRDKRTKQRVISALHQIRDCGAVVYNSGCPGLNEKASKVARNLILGAW